MNVEIAREEYEKLLDLLSIANSVLTGHKTEDDPRTAPYEKIIQKFYALSKQMDLSGKIEFDSDLERYFPTATFEETSEARKFLDEFADETFWHELIYRFTERDLERQLGGHEKLRSLRLEERFNLETPIEDKYAGEFEEYGIERLEVVERFDTGGMSPRTSD